jgi:predicted ArsR family transcriptional regulator
MLCGPYFNLALKQSNSTAVQQTDKITSYISLLGEIYAMPESGGTSDEEILDAIVEHRAPAVGTSDIADAVGVTRQAADARLRSLHDDGLVTNYQAGKSLVWWLTTAGERFREKE